MDQNVKKDKFQSLCAKHCSCYDYARVVIQALLRHRGARNSFMQFTALKDRLLSALVVGDQHPRVCVIHSHKDKLWSYTLNYAYAHSQNWGG